MKKSKLNLVIDTLMLLCVSASVGIGLLIKFVLVPGYQRWRIYGRNVNLFLWGFDRHQWGTIHLMIGLTFLALLVLHIVLHWDMILGIYRRLIPNPLARRISVLILVCIMTLLFGFACLVKPEVQEQGQGKGRIWRQCEGQCDIPDCPPERY